MKKGDFVTISYTGNIRESGELFDTTDENAAKEANVYNPQTLYEPMCIIVGEGKTLKGIEKELENMNVGEEREFEIAPEDGFGKRSPKLLRLIPASEFQKNNMTPQAGMVVNIGQLQGKILSSNSGRVRVDFNHPLAGRYLKYKVKIHKQLKTENEKIEGLLRLYLHKHYKLDMKDSKITIESKHDIPDNVRKMITDDINKHIKKYEIEFKTEKLKENESKSAEK